MGYSNECTLIISFLWVVLLTTMELFPCVKLAWSISVDETELWGRLNIYLTLAKRHSGNKNMKAP